MNCTCDPSPVCCPRGSAPILLARVLRSDGAALVPADVSSIAWARTNRTRPSDPAQAGSLAPANVITALGSDPLWTMDHGGRNFAWQAPPSLLGAAAAGEILDVEALLTPATGYPIVARWAVRVG